MKRYGYVVVVFLIALNLSMCRYAKATELRPDEGAAAHFGTSYVLTMLSYGALTRLGMPKLPATLMSILIVGVGTSMKEMHDFEPSTNDVKWNMLGVGAAVGTTLIFEF